LQDKQMAKLSKRHKQLIKIKETHTAATTAEEALQLIKQAPAVKFDQAVEVHIRLSLDSKASDQQVRSTVNLPGGTGKTVRVAVIAKGEKVKEAKDAGADFAGSEELIAKIGDGFLDFDKLVCTPDMMAALSKLGKLLGPKGLMPNPKDGTVTLDVSKIIKELKAGKVSFRSEKDGGVVHMAIGKLSFDESRILKNLAAVVDQVQKIKPAGIKGNYIKSVYLSSTMGPGIRLDLSKLTDLNKHSAA
jgi:large subunit ribosomal protein L1